MPSPLIPSSTVNPGEGPRTSSGGGGGGGAASSLTAHITDPTDAHAASAIGYGGGPPWADGVTNPAASVEDQIDKIISDLADTSMGGGPTGVGASKIGMPSIAAATYGITYSSTNVYTAISEVRLARYIGYRGTNFPGVGYGAEWADTTGTTTGNVEDTINEIVTTLAAGTGPAKIGTAAVNDAVHGINYVGTTLSDRLTLLQNAAFHAYDTGPSWFDGSANVNDSVKDTIDNIVYRLIDAPLAGSASGATKIGIHARSSWLGGRTNPGAISVFAAIDKIITDLAAATASDDGAERIGAAAGTGLAAGSVRSQLNALDLGWGKLDRQNVWTETQELNEPSDTDTALETNVIPTNRKKLWRIQTGSGPNRYITLHSTIDSDDASRDALDIGVNTDWNGVTWGHNDSARTSHKFVFDNIGRLVIRDKPSGSPNWNDASWQAGHGEYSSRNIKLGNLFPSAAPATFVTSIELANGGILFRNVANGDVTTLPNESNPSANEGFTNTLKAKNTPKAWGLIESGSSITASSLLDGFNIAGVSGSGNDIIVTIASDMADSNYAIVTQMCSSGSGRFTTVNALSSGQFTIGAYDVSDGADLQLNGVGAAVVLIAFVVFGRQD